MKKSKKIFLTAEWKNLIMANYEIDASILLPYIPAKTELDFWNGKCYVSFVGFMFENVKLKGIKVPFHVNFPEVNLRFYVKYKEKEVYKRGVVFISEIVNKHAICIIANLIYKENYSTLPMRNSFEQGVDTIKAGYHFRKEGWNSIEVIADAKPEILQTNSEEEFITEHFWGYSGNGKLKTVEYHVEHPRWQIHKVNEFAIDCDFGKLYGKDFQFLNNRKPDSVFLAAGSEVKVFDRNFI